MQTMKLDRDGNLLDDDDDIIPDGGMLRVAMPFMDHLSTEVRRALGLQDGVIDRIAHPAGYHQPGSIPISDELRIRAMQARDSYISWLGQAWKNPLSEQPTKQSSPRSSNDEAEQAYRAYVDRISNAWRYR
jgi:hypothetical protein